MATVKVIRKDTRSYPEARLLEPHFVLRPQFWKVIGLVQPVRHDDPDRDKQLRDGRLAYDEGVHKGRLHCAYCTLPMTFYNAAKKAGAGNLTPAAAHFQKTPVARALTEFNDHDDNCPITLREMEAAAKTEEDATPRAKDRIMINEPGVLNDHAKRIALKGGSANDQPIYARDQGRKEVRVVHPELADRERVSVPDFVSLKALLVNHDLKRLRGSVVVANASITPFENFVVRYVSADGWRTPFHDLVDRLRNGACHPVMMEARVEKIVDGKRFLSAGIDNGDGRTIIPQFWLDSPEARRAFSTMTKDGADELKIGILGVPRISVCGHEIFINVSILSASQFGECDFPALVKEARRNQKRREHNAPIRSGMTSFQPRSPV